jgi:hypothetical protein
MRKNTILYIFIIISTLNNLSAYDIKKETKSRTFDDWRFGIGSGVALYLGDQMDLTITFKYGEFHELRPNLTLFLL